MNSLAEIQRDWEALGTDDPLWAVLNDPRCKGQGWSTADFLGAGQEEIGEIFSWLAKKHLHPPSFGNALDFGCGAGRLTQALADRFEKVTGLDISAPMLEAAKRLHPPQGCHFQLNTSSNLAGIPAMAFDFVYSSIVLQHIPHPFSTGYVREFCRVARPGGLIVFQIPTGRSEPLSARIRKSWQQGKQHLALRSRLRRLLRGEGVHLPEPGEDSGRIQMHCVSAEEIKKAVASGGGEIVGSAYSNSCVLDFNGRLRLSDRPVPGAGYISEVFAIRKK